MKILDCHEISTDTGFTASARVEPEGAGTAFELRFSVEGAPRPTDRRGDSYAVGMLAACMFEAEDMSLDRPISATLSGNLAQAQTILSSWYDDLAPVAFRSGERDTEPPMRRLGGVACCFTAGVDSWYSLLRNEARVTHLLLVRGFDIGLKNDRLWDMTRQRVGSVAERLGKRLITCETNLRQLADKGRCSWGRTYPGDFWGRCLHGAALASVGLLLSEAVGSMIVPATHSYRQLKAWGSSPLLDPLWSGDLVEFVHDGCEARRIEKIRTISGCDLALATLRVCYGDTLEYNCGSCEKCLRTLLALRLFGALDRARTFPDGLDLGRVRRLAPPRHVAHHYDDLLAEARRVGDGAAARAVEAAIGRRISPTHTLARLKRAARANSRRARAASLFERVRGLSLPRRRRSGPPPGDRRPARS